MTTATKTFCAISIAGFAAGSIANFGGFEVNPMLTAVLPTGAIFLGVFLISLILEKEVARFDEEQARRLALARQYSAAAKTDSDP